MWLDPVKLSCVNLSVDPMCSALVYGLNMQWCQHWQFYCNTWNILPHLFSISCEKHSCHSSVKEFRLDTTPNSITCKTLWPKLLAHTISIKQPTKRNKISRSLKWVPVGFITRSHNSTFHTLLTIVAHQLGSLKITLKMTQISTF